MNPIRGSVGLRGVNQPDDVKIVQELLNRVPYNLGGPLEKLDVDGICGRKTNHAIEKLQAKQFGWNTVTTLIRPNDKTMLSLMKYDLSDFIDNSPRPSIVAPPAPKAVSTRFLIMLAAAPQSQMGPENFYFLIQNADGAHLQALYHFGGFVTEPMLPRPVQWSTTSPGYTLTPKPIGVEDWGGDAILREKVNGSIHKTEMFFAPVVLDGHIIRTELHAHVQPDQTTPGSFGSTTSARLTIIDSSGLQL